jgi:hypothetical protein
MFTKKKQQQKKQYDKEHFAGMQYSSARYFNQLLHVT